MLKSLKLISAVGLSTIFSNEAAAQAACPDPIPDEVTPAQLIACVKKVKTEVDTLRSLATIPSGAVLAFDTLSPTVPAECPEGWRSHRELRGRMIVGAGVHSNTDENGIELSKHTIGDTGGAETHKLGKAELPPHEHNVGEFIGGGADQRVGGGPYTYVFPHGSIKPPHTPGNFVSGKTSGLLARAHNNMPPYLALLYCIKE